MLPIVPGGRSNARGTECNRANPLRKAGADSVSWSGPHFSLVGRNPARRPRCRITSPWHQRYAWGWGLGPVCPLCSLLTHGSSQGCLEEPACCLRDPTGPQAPSCSAVVGRQNSAPSKGGVGLQIAFEQDGECVCVSVLVLQNVDLCGCKS